MSAPAVADRTRQAQDYLAAVEHELADLPVDDRSALLEDLAAHLEALAAEDDDRDIAVRLGTPASYAADLRAAAGLPARGAPRPSALAGLRERLGEVTAQEAVTVAVRESRRLLGELRPAWWVLRGYLLISVPCLLTSDAVRDFPVPAPLGSRLLGVLLVAAAVAGSVALGRRTLPKPRRVLVGVAGGLLGALGVLAALNGWSGVTPEYVYVADSSSAPDELNPLISRYGPVTDIHPYAADGTPLEDVLLYDQDGRPLHVGFQQWWADGCARVLDQPLAADGVAVPNAYPQDYVLDPAGVDLSRSVPRPAGSCVEDLPRPQVPLPTFPSESVAPAPAD
ncbi:UNVERIFIED_ORG: hypothetical protein E4P37_03795 [Bacillus sp. AZ43]